MCGSLVSTVLKESGFPARDRRGSAVHIWAALALLTQTAREISLFLRNRVTPSMFLLSSLPSLHQTPPVLTFNVAAVSAAQVKHF